MGERVRERVDDGRAQAKKLTSSAYSLETLQRRFVLQILGDDSCRISSFCPSWIAEKWLGRGKAVVCEKVLQGREYG